MRLGGTPQAAAALILALLLPAAGAAPNKQEELRELRARIEKVQKDLQRSEETRSEAADALRSTEKSISEVNRNLTLLAREQGRINQELSVVARQLESARNEVAVQQALLVKLVRHQYVHGEIDGVRLLLQGQDRGEAERQLVYLAAISRWRAKAVRQHQAAIERLAVLEATAKDKRNELAANAAEQKKARVALQSERANRLKVFAKVKADITRNRREISRLKRDEDRLTKLIEQLAKTLAKGREERAAARRGEAVDDVADARFAGSAFETLRGKLKLPVRGELRGRFGSPREDGGVTWKGLFIKTDSGSPVKSVADGQVVFADWVRGFGNLVVVDHGKAYMSVYGNNESILKQVGDPVTSGESIATAGATGGALESGVYFELRHEGKPFDPMKWVSR
ncbi:MAG TPA: peptidoglycan DD-metalloendopeptidase family protein [Usitatibacteraceae bacterium]|nr:peptidoglycan DD-metalloendopeptidase family protein [Usitatibacteraceae bacterium]